MVNDFSAYLAIFAIAFVTLVTRLLGPSVMGFITATPKVRIFLDAMSPSVLAAIVATTLVQGGLREAVAVLCAGVIMFVWRQSVLAMSAGMACAALWSLLSG